MARQFKYHAEEILSGASGGQLLRWSFCDYNDRVLMAHPSLTPHYWPGYGVAKPIPGLPAGEGYSGIEVVASHVMVWKDATFKWSAQNDMTQWLPVGETAVSLRTGIAASFRQPDAGGLTDWVFITDPSRNFVVDQYVRLDTGDTSSFYTVSQVWQGSTMLSISVKSEQTVDPDEEKRIFFQSGGGFLEDDFLSVAGVATDLQVTAASTLKTDVFFTGAGSEPVPAIGMSFLLQLANPSGSLAVGDVVSLGSVAGYGQDIYEVAQVVDTFGRISLTRLGQGESPLPTGYLVPEGFSLSFQPYADVLNIGTVRVVIPAGASVSGLNAVKLTPKGLTGEVLAGDLIPEGSYLQSVDANDAGEGQNIGSQINGEILSIVAIGEYGYILKTKSIQSMQFVGRQAGTFFIRPEILDEGPISRNAWCKMFDNNKVSGIIFVGRKEIFKYTGGTSIEPIGRQFTKEIFGQGPGAPSDGELDRSRVDEIVCYHHEKQNEVWIVYPVLGGGMNKVFIYNYVFDSVAVDDYPTALGGITAVGSIDWESAVTWEEFSEADGGTNETWEDKEKAWYEYVDDGLQRFTFLGVAADAPNPVLGELPDTTVPRLLLHGREYSRASRDNCHPAAYECVAETQDFDFENPTVWKYAYTVQMMVDVRQSQTRPMQLFVQLGGRDNLDSDIRWSAPTPVEVSGNGMRTTQANIRMAGRFIRIRFSSNAVGCNWKIASYKLFARPGGKY